MREPIERLRHRLDRLEHLERPVEEPADYLRPCREQERAARQQLRAV
jgi:hypothetical protein